MSPQFLPAAAPSGAAVAAVSTGVPRAASLRSSGTYEGAATAFAEMVTDMTSTAPPDESVAMEGAEPALTEDDERDWETVAEGTFVVVPVAEARVVEVAAAELVPTAQPGIATVEESPEPKPGLTVSPEGSPDLELVDVSGEAPARADAVEPLAAGAAERQAQQSARATQLVPRRELQQEPANPAVPSAVEATPVDAAGGTATVPDVPTIPTAETISTAEMIAAPAPWPLPIETPAGAQDLVTAGGDENQARLATAVGQTAGLASGEVTVEMGQVLAQHVPVPRFQGLGTDSQTTQIDLTERALADGPRGAAVGIIEPVSRAEGGPAQGTQTSATELRPRPGGRQVDVAMFDVQVTHVAQAFSGAPSPGEPAPLPNPEAGGDAPAVPVATRPSGLESVASALALGDIARTLAVASYAALDANEASEISTPWELGPFDTDPPHQQVVRAVRLQWANGVSEARLRLHPEHLGEVTIDLRVESGRVSATLRIDNPVAADWIRAQRAELQASLSGQGLDLGSLEVVVDPDGRRRHSSAHELPSQGRRRRGNADLPRFEVLA